MGPYAVVERTQTEFSVKSITSLCIMVIFARFARNFKVKNYVVSHFEKSSYRLINCFKEKHLGYATRIL